MAGNGHTKTCQGNGTAFIGFHHQLFWIGQQSPLSHLFLHVTIFSRERNCLSKTVNNHQFTKTFWVNSSITLVIKVEMRVILR